ncbi:MAG TPA: hypothetical protein EYN74_02320 [Nitrospirales bacterium]|nr:hypothetical protein [Nitrospirales bacterium]
MKIESRPFLDPQHPTEWKITRVDFDGAQRRYAAANARRDSFLQQVMGRSRLVQLSNKAANRIPGMISTSLSGSPNTRFLGQHGVNFCIEPPSYTRAWETTTQILTRLQQDTKAIGSTLVVFSVPALQDVDGPYRKKIEAKAPDPDTVCFDQAPGHQRLQDILRARKIQYVDLLPVFRAITQSGTRLFWESDRHWNPEGHNIAAEHVLSHLVTEKLLIPEQPATDLEDATRLP